MSTTLSEIWYTRCPVPTPVGLAAQLGYLGETFEEVGVLLVVGVVCGAGAGVGFELLGGF